jgi:Arc/MetJ-type ribon-helix-helix transcriptional regulator
MVEDSITVTLSSKENIEWIRRKVRDGDFASESEAILEGVSRMREEDGELEEWLRVEVCQRYDRLKANPESGIPMAQLVKNLEERRRERTLQPR